MWTNLQRLQSSIQMPPRRSIRKEAFQHHRRAGFSTWPCDDVNYEILVREATVTDSDSMESGGPELERYIRLAHFSIKEFLTSGRIEDGPASFFSIKEGSANIHISESCLKYHLHICEVECLTLSPESLMESFSLRGYSITHWRGSRRSCVTKCLASVVAELGFMCSQASD